MKSIYGGFVKRVLLSILIVFLSIISFGATYYIAPNGNDTNAGTITSPWATLNKVWTVLKAGDTIYLRGGTYAFNSQQSLRGKSGTSGSLINVLAYPNETPILTKSSSYPATFGIFFSGDYFYWKGIEITGYTQPVGSVNSFGFKIENSSYNTFENLKVHGNGGGMHLSINSTTLHCTGNLILNSDFYENQDPLTTGDPYGNADGLAIAWNQYPNDVNTVKGCRFWWNSDDGFDMYMNDGMVNIDNCWSFYNGYIPSTFSSGGDGMGIKFGTSTDQTRTTIKRKATNCISVKNRAHGYGTNDLYGEIQMLNCDAYLNNAIGIHLATNNLINFVTNCLSYANTTNLGLSANTVATTNSWQNGITVTNADFKSLDTSLLLAARNSDGSLPVTDFLQLTSTSKLINCGTNVGIPYSGTAPDLGSCEANSVTVPALPTVYNVTGGGSYCNGGSGLAVGLNNSQIGINYQLKLNGTNSGTPVAGTGSALNFGSKSVAGNYTIVATNVSTSSTSTMSGSAIITVNPLPTVTFASGVSSVDLGSTGNVYTTQSGMSNYKWIVSTGGTITSGGGTTNNAVTVTWNTAGAQSVSVNYTNSTGCTASVAANYPVTVNAAATPIVYNVTGGGSYCSGGSGTTVGLSNSQIGINYQLKLNGTNSGSPVAGTGSALNFGTKTVVGTYTIEATNVSTSATSTMSGSAVISVNPLPNVTFTNGVPSANVGSTGNIYTTQSGMSNYKWIVSTGGTITSGGGTTNNAVTVTWNTAGAQSVSVNYTNSTGCIGSVAANYSVTINSPTVNTSPPIYNVTGGGSFCSGGSGVTVGLNNSQVGNNYQLLVNGVNSGSPVAGTGSSISFGSQTSAGTYTVLSTNASTLVTSVMAGNANVKVNPIYSISENITIKEGDAYQGWTASGQYTRILTSKFGCDSTVTTNLTVEKTPIIAVPEITQTQTIQLKKGNNLVSTYLNPQSLDAGVVVRPLIDSNSLISLQDEDYNTISYSSQIESWVNNIGSINTTEGYLLNANNDCTFKVIGTPITLPLAIPLKPGWNIISYPRTDAVNAMSIVQTLIDQNKLVKVQDELGNSIENIKKRVGWRNNIGNFIPGKAYKIYVSSYATLNIQANYAKSSVIMPQSAQAEHFKTIFVGNGVNHMNINLVDLSSNLGISAGDELAAFDGNICVGALKITEDQLANGWVSLVASYSTSDQVVDGFTEGNQIKIYRWSNVSGTETEVKTDVIDGELKYAQNGSVLASMNSLATSTTNLSDALKIKVFPNPSTGRFTVEFSAIPDFGSRIDILDLSGRIILSRQISGLSEEFNLENQPTGMYIVKTIFGSSQILNKLIINK